MRRAADFQRPASSTKFKFHIRSRPRPTFCFSPLHNFPQLWPTNLQVTVWNMHLQPGPNAKVCKYYFLILRSTLTDHR